MRALVLASDAAVEPFGDPPREVWLADAPLAGWQARAIAATGTVPPPEHLAGPGALANVRGPALVLGEHVFVTTAFLLELLRVAQVARGAAHDARPVVAAIDDGPLTRHFQPVSSMGAEPVDRGGAGRVLPDVFVLPDGYAPPPEVATAAALREHLRGTARRATVPVDQHHVRRRRLPPLGPPPHEETLPDGDRIACHVEHWFHMQRLAPVLPRLMARAALGRAAVDRGRSVVGPGCDVHPTALVESSVLGRDVKVGPFASVRDAFVGAGAVIGEHSHVLASVIGPGCHVLARSYFVQCLSWPDATLGNLMASRSVYGRGLFLASGVVCVDHDRGRPIRVRKDGRDVPTGATFLGHACGHESILGARAIFMPGLALPPRRVVVMRPEEGVARFPADLPAGAPVVWDRASLVPLERVAPPGYRPPELADPPIAIDRTR